MSSIECHLFFVMNVKFSERYLTHFVVSYRNHESGVRPPIFTRLQELFTHLTVFSDSHIEFDRQFSVGALRRPSVAN